MSDKLEETRAVLDTLRNFCAHNLMYTKNLDYVGNRMLGKILNRVEEVLKLEDGSRWLPPGIVEYKP